LTLPFFPSSIEAVAREKTPPSGTHAMQEALTLSSPPSLLREFRALKQQAAFCSLSSSSSSSSSCANNLGQKDGDHGSDDDDVAWIKCFVHVGMLVAHPATTSPLSPSSLSRVIRSSVSTKCLLPFKRSRLKQLDDNGDEGGCAGDIYVSMPTKRVPASCFPSDVDGDGGPAYHVRHITVMQLMRDGLEGMIAPIVQRERQGKKRHRIECETSVPYFIKDLVVEGIYYQGPSAAAGACNNSNSSSSTRRKKRDHNNSFWSSSLKNYHPAKAPSFENICGSVFVGMMYPVSIPPPSQQQMLQMMQTHHQQTDHPQAKGRRRGRKKQPWFMAVRGTEIFTVHGNLVLKKRCYGTSVKFMVGNDMVDSFLLLFDILPADDNRASSTLAI
jgi:hypothetical protein